MLSESEAGCGAPLLQLDGYEGPLDLLLELARAQKVDLSRISILRLVEQYLAVVEATRQVRLELAADWLVMAAWLAWLKSRLLLPKEADDPNEGEAASELLAARLAELAHVERAAAWLGGRDRLGHTVFARACAENLVEIDRSGLVLDLPLLLGAYMTAMRRTAKRRVWRPRPPAFWTMQDAMQRLHRLLGGGLADSGPAAAWCAIEQFLPDFAPLPTAAGAQVLRAALAATLLAGLEMARNGEIELRQDDLFGTILLRRRESAMRPDADAGVDREAAD